VINESLKVRKQELVRNVIYDAAIDLFAVKGFDETTVEEVAVAAGVSRRSFFRYFASKDDLLAHNVVHYGDVLKAAVTTCPATFTPLQVVRETVLTIARGASGHSHTRQVIEIAERSASARQAHTSRMREVEDNLAAAFATRLNSISNFDVQPRLLASLTLTVMNVAIMSWYRGDCKDLVAVANQVFTNLTRFISDRPNSTHSEDDLTPRTKPNVLVRARRVKIAS
jgi:AcrR family transcriptional regulator